MNSNTNCESGSRKRDTCLKRRHAHTPSEGRHEPNEKQAAEEPEPGEPAAKAEQCAEQRVQRTEQSPVLETQEYPYEGYPEDNDRENGPCLGCNVAIRKFALVHDKVPVGHEENGDSNAREKEETAVNRRRVSADKVQNDHGNTGEGFRRVEPDVATIQRGNFYFHRKTVQSRIRLLDYYSKRN